MGAGRHRGRARPRGHARGAPATTPRRRCGGLRRRRRHRARARGPRPGARARRARRRVRPRAGRRILLTPRGRSPPRYRIAHAGGDATAARSPARSSPRCIACRTTRASASSSTPIVVDLLQVEDERVCGVTLHVIGEGQVDGVGAAHARAVVLATGGLGQVYGATTNPSVSTGDGMAVALRAGAVMADLEFVQFHPTVLWLGQDADGQQPLISEAVRGEGRRPRRRRGGSGSWPGAPMADLAPRDVRLPAIVARMRATGTDHVYLDARHRGRESSNGASRRSSPPAGRTASTRSPTIVPVAPAQHYASGGVAVDPRRAHLARGAVGVRRVLVHGRPRRQPAGLELAARGPRLRARRSPRTSPPGWRAASCRRRGPRRHRTDDGGVLLDPDRRREVQQAMSRGAGAVLHGRLDGRDGAGAGPPRAGGVEHPPPAPVRVGDDQPLHLGQLLTHVAVGARRPAAATSATTSRPRRRDTGAATSAPSAARRDRDDVVPTPSPTSTWTALMTRARLAFPAADAADLVARALLEDLGPHYVDVTTLATIPAEQERTGEVVARPTASWPGSTSSRSSSTRWPRCSASRHRPSSCSPPTVTG